jgi:hypothetical protein
MTPNKETLINYLQTVDTGINIQFTKVDGTVRDMKATLYEGNIPYNTVVERSDSISKIKENPDIVKVYDMENKGWRSFRFDSLISVNL